MDREQDKDTRISTSWVVIVIEAPLRGMKRLHEFDIFDSNKELTLHKNLEHLNSSLQLVLVEPTLGGGLRLERRKGKNVMGELRLKRTKGKNTRWRNIFFISP